MGRLSLQYQEFETEESQEEVAAEPEQELSTDVSRRAPYMHPVVYKAAKRGRIEIKENRCTADEMEYAISSQKTPQLNTVLHIAASLGHTQFVEDVFKYSRELWKEENSAGELAFHVAASCGHLSTLKKLVSLSDSGFLVIQNNEGNTALHLALINKYREVDYLVLKTKYNEIADFLVEKNPKLSYCLNKEHKSPVHMAAEAGDAEMLKFMMEKAQVISMAMVQAGGNIQLPFEEVKLIAHAAITGKNIDVLDRVMSENPLRIKDRDSEGMTPLSYAASIGYLEGVRYLNKKFTFYMYESDQNGSFPIHTASSRGHIKIVQEFIETCPDSVELLNHQGRNILHVAAMRGKAKVVNYMLKMPELEMLINKKDEDGNTSLHLASKGGHPKVVSILTWDKRVDLKLLNDEGKTALDVAGRYSGKVPSYREHLTWLALRYANVSHAPSPRTTKYKLPSSKPGGQSSMDKDKEIITGNSQSSKPREAPNLDKDKETITENSQSSKPGEAPNMDKDKETITENSQSSKPREAPNKDNYKDRVNTLLLVATLVATVTFAAGFTVPGGNDDSDPHKGMAKFLRHHLFQVFIISNTIAMYSSVTVVVTLIWAQLGDLNLANASLRFAIPMLGLALIMVSSAFMTGSYLMVRGLNWLALLVLIIGSFFILILTILYLPLCLPNSLPRPFFRYIVYYPFCLLVIVTRGNTNDGEEK